MVRPRSDMNTHPTTETLSDVRAHPSPDDPPGWRLDPRLLLAMALLLVVLFQAPVNRWLSAPVAQNWMTVFIAVVTQALPFLVFGVVLSAVIVAFVPPAFWTRALPRRPGLAVPVAGVAGMVLPGCECA